MEYIQTLAGPDTSNETACWRCKLKISPTDNYCRYCGIGQGRFAPWYYKHWGVMVSFLLIGPFNLILVWRSPSLSIKSKLIYTAVFGYIGLWACYKIYRFMAIVHNMINSFMPMT